MKLSAPLMLSAVLAAPLFAQQAPPIPLPQDMPQKAASKKSSSASSFKNDDEKILYALGVVVGRNVAAFALSPTELKVMEMGLRDQATGQPLKIDLNAYGPRIQELQAKRMAVKAEAEKSRAKAYLQKAGKEKGAQVSPSGLIYTELRPGTGASPSASDTVHAHYEGRLTDGTVFDSSYKRGAPTPFPLNGVIKCWTEGIQKMKVGGKARLICPSDIGYGDGGNPPKIPGGATLVFDVELVEIEKPAASK